MGLREQGGGGLNQVNIMDVYYTLVNRFPRFPLRGKAADLPTYPKFFKNRQKSVPDACFAPRAHT